MNKRPLETVMGIIVIFATVLFISFAYNKIDVRALDGYPLTVKFQKAGGLESGSDVRISGIKVGTVVKRSLNDDFIAEVEMLVKKDIALPEDTLAVIADDGLMGGKFVNLVPGKSKKILQGGSEISKVKDFKSLEDSVSEMIFLATKDPLEN